MTSLNLQGLRRSPWVKRAAWLLVVAVALAVVFRDVIFGVPVEVYTAKRSDLVQTVVASGRVMTPQRVSVGAVITGWVARIPVEEGQTVRRGDVLIVLDDRDLRAAVSQASAAVAQAQARIRQLHEVALPSAEQALVQAEANLALARAQQQRNHDLREKGFVSQSALDDSTRNIEVAQSQLRAAHLQVQTNGPGGSDMLLAQSALQQAQASLAVAQVRLDQSIIRAPADGILISRDVEPGNVVQPGKELMALAPAGETQIVVQIDEKHLAQLALGQKALGSADAYPADRFAAELFYINPGIDPLRGSVEVKLRVPKPPAFLRQDMTVSVDIEVARCNGTIVVPADAVFDANASQPWVLAVDNGRAERRPVKLGLKGDARVEVLEGVAAGDRLVAIGNASVAPGSRVRIVGDAATSPS